MLSGWINNILAENLGTNSHVSENQIRPHSKMGLVSKSPIIGSLTEKICDRNVPWPKCSLTEMYPDRNVLWSKCSVTEKFRDRNVPWPKRSVTEMFCDRKVLTEMSLCRNVSDRNVKQAFWAILSEVVVLITSYFYFTDYFEVLFFLNKFLEEI